MGGHRLNEIEEGPTWVGEPQASQLVMSGVVVNVVVAMPPEGELTDEATSERDQESEGCTQVTGTHKTECDRSGVHRVRRLLSAAMSVVLQRPLKCQSDASVNPCRTVAN